MDVVENSLEEGEEVIGKTYYEGEAEYLTIAGNIRLDYLLETLSDDICGQCHNCDREWPDLTDKEKDELETLILNYLEEHAPLRCYEAINVKEKKITEEDL
jgi:hypothetical protein